MVGRVEKFKMCLIFLGQKFKIKGEREKGKPALIPHTRPETISTSSDIALRQAASSLNLEDLKLRDGVFKSASSCNCCVGLVYYS